MGINNFCNNSNNTTSGNSAPPYAPSGAPMPLSLTHDQPDPMEFLINYNEKFQKADPAMFRDELIDQTMSVLIGKTKPNALLVGPAGCGKTRIAEEIARRIAINDPSIPNQLKDCIVYEFPLSSAVSGSCFVGEIEEKISSIISFASDPDEHAILFIDEIHQLVGKDSSYTKIAQIFKPALARGAIRVIGATTLQESGDLLHDPAFSRRFSRLIVDELTRIQTVEILKSARPSLLAHYGGEISIPDEVIELCAITADQFSQAGSHRPDSALTLMDRACADTVIARTAQRVQFQNDPVILNVLNSSPTVLSEQQLVNTAMQLMTGHAQKASVDKNHLLNALSPIKGQQCVLDTLCEQLIRRNLNLFPMTKPLTLLFAGSSGTGKTSVVKIIARELTGLDPITLNMTEYHSSASINRIIGAPAGYVGSDSHGELPFDILESNPYQVILLDEFEKASGSVQRLFMRAFDEGRLETASGKIIDFSKAIIIATTNAAFTEEKKRPVGLCRNEDVFVGTKDLMKHFDTALLNRFDAIYTFASLDIKAYEQIVQDLYVREAKRISRESPRIVLPDSLSDEDLDLIVKTTYEPAFGARPAFDAVKKKIEDFVLCSAN